MFLFIIVPKLSCGEREGERERGGKGRVEGVEEEERGTEERGKQRRREGERERWKKEEVTVGRRKGEKGEVVK